MPARSRRPRVIRAVVWTAIAFVLGAVLYFVTVAMIAPVPGEPVLIAGDHGEEVLIHTVFGLIGLVCLPFVLCLDGRTIPRSTLHPRVLAAEKLREFLTASGRGGEKHLDRDGSVESLQRRPGGWVPVTLGLIGIFVGTIGSLGAVAATIISIALAARRSWMLSLAVIIVGTVSLLVGFIITPTSLGGFELPVFIFSSVLLSIFVVIGVIRGAREQGLIDSAAQTLLRGQSRQERAIAEVRRSIARDMHDSLSHHLSVIAMYSGALSVREDLNPASVRESARLIADSARRSGVELREVLTMLRGDDQGTVVDPELEPLVRGRSDSVELVYTPPLSAACLRGLGTLERTTIYRFVQEAVTNAFKHAPGTRLQITVAADDAPETLLLIASNPLRPDPAEARTGITPPQRTPIAGSGLGLLGLRERMEAMGGDLVVSPGPDFVLRARIPAPGLGAAEPAPIDPAPELDAAEPAPIDSHPTAPPAPTPHTEEPT